MATGTGHDLHQLSAGIKEIRQSTGGHIDLETLPQLGFLGGDAGWALVGVADACSDAADGLHGCVGDGNPVGAEG